MSQKQNCSIIPSKKLSPESCNLPVSIYELKFHFRHHGCNGCSLGSQEGLYGPTLYRGNPKARIVVVGEAPGKQEDIECLPFVGPAGKKLDQIFASVGLDTNRDCYLCNMVSCRPLAPKGSGKENLVPSKDCIRACRPILLHQIHTVSPSIIVPVGNVALQISPELAGLGTITKVMGRQLKVSEFPDAIVFPMLHPSALLRCENTRDEKSMEYRRATWQHIQTLKELYLSSL